MNKLPAYPSRLIKLTAVFLLTLLFIQVGQTNAAPQAGCTSVTATTFTELQAALDDYISCADGDTLTIDLAGNTITYSAQLSTVANFTSAELVIANGTLDANGTGLVLEVFRGNVTLENTLLTGGTGSLASAIDMSSETNVTLINSTVTGNVASSSSTIDNGGTLTLTNTTISDNTTGIASYPAVINNSSSILNLNNSIIANTVDRNGAPVADCLNFSGTVNFSPGQSNLIEQDHAMYPCDGGGTNTLTGDPLLGALANNGGIMQTMALGASSPAINAGDNASAVDGAGNPLTTDARGSGFSRLVGTVDLGAFERQPPSVAFASATDGQTESLATPALLTLTTSDGAATVAPSTVQLAVSGGTLNNDYTVTTPFTIPAGTASGTPFAIPGFAIVDDNIEEANETLTLTLSNPSGATLGAQATMDYTILDDDRVPPAPFTADVLSVVVIPLNDATSIGSIYYNFPATGNAVILQGGQDDNRKPILSEILTADVPPNVGNSIGDTAWHSLPGTPPSTGFAVDNRVALYIDPNDLLGTAAFTVADITSVAWRTNRQSNTLNVEVDWYALEYTAVIENDPMLSRITAESDNSSANDGTWQTWDTLNYPLYDPVQAGTGYGWAGNNIFQNDFFAGPIDWGQQANSGSTDIIDYRQEVVNSIAVATASNWSDKVDGYIDYLVFNFDDGSTTYEMIVDLEADPVPNEPTIDKAFGATTIDIGTTTSLTFTLTNPNSTPLSGLAFSDTLPNNGGGIMTFTSPTPTVDTCTTLRGSTNVIPNQISVSDVYLAGGDSCEIVMEVQTSDLGTYVNTSGPLTTTTIGTAFGVGTDTAVATLNVVLPQTRIVTFAAATDSNPESVPTPTLLNLITSDGQATKSDIIIDLAVSGGTVTQDYTATTPFTIPAGTNPGIIAIPGFAIVNDTIEEPDETLTLTLSNPSGASLGGQTTMDYTITNDDSTTTVAFAAATDSGPESVTNPILLTVTTSDGQATKTDAIIGLTVSGGTVTQDYTVTTPFTIPAGTNPGTIAIPGFAIVDDTVAEPDETLTLTLGNPSGASLGGQTTMDYTITNDDTATYLTFLPIVMTPGYPDLVVEDVTVTNTDITVVIRNIGSAPVTDGFYVDAYLGLLNPAQPPTGVNDIWENFSPQGVVWGIDASITPLAAGDALTLTLNDGYQLDAFSNFTMPLGSGTAVYVQVDSAAAGNTNGGVLELHETNGGAYNNILGPVLAP